jgi:hypothetical protein
MLRRRSTAFVLHRPFGPQIRNSKRERRPTPRSLSHRISGDIKAKPDNRRREGLYHSHKVVPVPDPASRMRHDLISLC